MAIRYWLSIELGTHTPTMNLNDNSNLTHNGFRQGGKFQDDNDSYGFGLTGNSLPAIKGSSRSQPYCSMSTEYQLGECRELESRWTNVSLGTCVHLTSLAVAAETQCAGPLFRRLGGGVRVWISTSRSLFLRFLPPSIHHLPRHPTTRIQRDRTMQ